MSGLDAAAVAYAVRDEWPVVPLIGKNPGQVLGTGWQKKASRDPEVIRGWFHDHPMITGIGIYLPGARLVVVDLDDLSRRAEIEALGVRFDRGVIAYSGRLDDQGRRGMHAYYLLPPGIASEQWGNVVIAGCEVRANGQQVAPPSTHPETGLVYEWAHHDAQLEVLPQAVVKARQEARSSGAVEQTRHTELLLVGKQAAKRALAERIREMQAEGRGRAFPSAEVSGLAEFGTRYAMDDLAATDGAAIVGESNGVADRARQALAGTASYVVAAARRVFTPLARPADATRPVESWKNESSLAEGFAAAYDGALRHVHDRDYWIVQRDGRWWRDETGEVLRAARDHGRHLLHAAAEIEDEERRKKELAWANTAQNYKRIDSMLRLASVTPELVTRSCDLDTDPWLFACANGTLDLRSGRISAGDPDDLITLGTDVAYHPDSEAPRWERFLAEIFAGDESLAGYLQRLVGYCLTGDTSEHVVPILEGEGGNGKDTLLKPVFRILGDHAASTPFETWVKTRDDKGPRNDLAALSRSRLVVSSESNEGRHLDEAIIKQVSGGGDITCRYLYGEFFTYTPMFKVWLVTNHKPRVKSNGDAIWRRLSLIPFTESFIGREDRTLDVQLASEIEGIFAWAVRGCLEWQRGGLKPPDRVRLATAEYRGEEDTLGAFIAERCKLEGSVATTEFRSAYEAFCDELGERPLAPSVVGKRLKRNCGVERRGGSSSAGHTYPSTYEPLSLRT